MVIEIASLLPVGFIIGQKLIDKGLDILIDKSLSFEDLNIRFYDAVQNTAETLDNRYPDMLGGTVNYFFKKEEIVDDLFILMFKDAKQDISGLKKHIDLDSIPDKFIEDFLNKLRIEILADEILNPIFSNQRIYYSLASVEYDVNQIAKNSSLTLGKLNDIQKSLEVITKTNFDFSSFIENYFDISYNILSQVNYIGLGISSSIKRRRNKLSDIYVKPRLKTNQKFKLSDAEKNTEVQEEKDEYNYSEPLQHSKKIVVLGDAGSGKSTYVKSLFCDIVQENVGNLEHQPLAYFIPFRVELRKYLTFKNKDGGNLLNYISWSLEKEFSLENISDEVVSNILHNQKTIVFFDGLDEIFKVEDKINIRNDIEAFHTIYEKTYSITTSRNNGYYEAPLSEDFSVFRIESFENNQIDEYLTKWYKVEEPKPEIRKREIANFNKSKSGLDKELLQNPLLLSLIIILYRNNLQLPESKLEIYQSCTKTLVDKWDASKDLEILIEQSILDNKDKILANLAFWQYLQFSDDSSEVTYEKAKRCVAETIKDKIKIGDEYTSADKAEFFMRYAEKRSIYFENQFTHKTFLEYYTAYWIFTNYELKGKFPLRNEIIEKYIDNSFWSIVLELLINLIDRDQPDSEIIDDLVEYQLSSTKSYPFLLNCLPSIKNISTEKVKLIISKTIKHLISYKLKHSPEPFLSVTKELDGIYINHFKALEGSVLRSKFIEQIFIETINDLNEEKWESEEELLLLCFEIYHRYGRRISKPLPDTIAKFFERSIPYHKNNRELYTHYTSLIEVNHDTQIDFFIDNYGPDSILEEMSCNYLRMRFGSPLLMLLFNYSYIENIPKIKNDIKDLISKGVDIEKLLNEIMLNADHIYFSQDVSQLKKIRNAIKAEFNNLDRDDIRAVYSTLYLLTFETESIHIQNFGRDLSRERFNALKEFIPSLQIGEEKKSSKIIFKAIKEYFLH